VQRIGELDRVLGPGDRCEDLLHALTTGAFERELDRTGPVGDVEAREHLGDEGVVRRERPHARLVVVRDQRPHTREHLLDRDPGDRDHLQAGEARPARLVDDVHAVGEVVEPHGVEVQLALVAVQREEPRVPVPVSRQRRDPHEPDEQVIRVEARSAPSELRHLGSEALPGDVPEQVRMEALELGAERSGVFRSTRDRRRASLGRAVEGHDSEGESDDGRPEHPA
jgi:hypothetical protein